MAVSVFNKIQTTTIRKVHVCKRYHGRHSELSLVLWCSAAKYSPTQTSLSAAASFPLSDSTYQVQHQWWAWSRMADAGHGMGEDI